MKNIVRALVLVLATTGVAASSHLSSISDKGNVSVSRMSALPRPLCPLNDPTGCHIGDLR